jgi:hypothetical protein
VLSMHREARAQIIGQLREVFDGRTEKSFGNGLRIEWEGKFGIVAGVTPIIARRRRGLPGSCRAHPPAHSWPQSLPA